MKDDMSRANETWSSRLSAAAGDLLLTGFAVVLTVASFATDNKAIAYLFPRLLALTMLVFCLLQLIIVFFGLEREKSAVTWPWWQPRAMLAMALIVIYVAVAEWLGFYAAAAIAFFAIVQFGAPARTKRQLVLAVFVAMCAVAVLYGLFSLLLQVQTPRGVLF